MKMHAVDRFFHSASVTAECWEWTGYIKPNGYGQFHPAHGQTAYAHRWSFQSFVGEIPHGLQIDHLCRNRKCVNPDHLEPVTNVENMRRAPVNGGGLFHAAKTHCIRGHEFAPDNTYSHNGKRHCRACKKEYLRARTS